jgi:hypothetical protein
LPVASLVYDHGILDASVFHGFYTCGALAPRSRSTNQNAQIAAKERTKIDPHARKVDVKSGVMTSSILLVNCLAQLQPWLFHQPTAA